MARPSGPPKDAASASPKADGHPRPRASAPSSAMENDALTRELSEVVTTASHREHAHPSKARPPAIAESESAVAPTAQAAESAASNGDALQQLIDQAVARLRKAQVAFNSPTEITLGAPQSVSLVMSFDTPSETLKEGIASQGPTATAEVPAAPEMEAVLVGSSGLTVRALQPDPKQAIPSHGKTEWDWDVEGSTAGPQMLTLSISAVLSAPGSPEYAIQTFNRKLNVTVSNTARVSQFISNNWQWLWAVLVVPLAGYMWGKVRKRPV